MTAIVTVKAVTRPAEVFRFPMDQGEPGDGGEWLHIDTVEPGETREYFAHSRKAIMIQTVPDIPE